MPVAIILWYSGCVKARWEKGFARGTWRRGIGRDALPRWGGQSIAVFFLKIGAMRIHVPAGAAGGVGGPPPRIFSILLSSRSMRNGLLM
jgi:hypothetical protein